MASKSTPANVHLDGAQIEQVQEFKYLGSVVQEKKVASSTDVHGRIGQAIAAFVSLKWCLWKRANISVKTKIHLFWTLILPILLYGSETWILLKQDLNKLEVFQMRCLRQILSISLCDRIRNETIRIRCDHQPTVVEVVQLRRLRWFRHICRMSITRTPYQLLWRKCPTEWKVQRAAPKKTWSKQIEEDLKKRRSTLCDAKAIAMDREAWKSVLSEVRNPAAPIAAYGLWRKPRPIVG
ncbi:RNA-directed DNA polymerase from mobile element jockey [Acipenser ruthenus]|uniref:RNA-directed DNA polymerase from mobile element jockey n=1 Tax=Acipenser ruthenus TaxID=7906 RepID=A0A444U5Z7_ACIRT|nr:RNA-directed DNA polymerase from mobile element jockey [Acipenser ruthenus]